MARLLKRICEAAQLRESCAINDGFPVLLGCFAPFFNGVIKQATSTLTVQPVAGETTLSYFLICH